jgi:RecJ-like exonuclease
MFDSPVIKMDSELKEALSEDLQRTLDDISAVLKDKPFVRIITHYDADGVCSSAVLASALRKKDIRFHVTFRKSLNDDFVEELNLEKCDCIFFLDMGSNNLEAITDLTENGTRVIVLDHHRVHDPKRYEDVLHLNCNQFDIDGMSEASSSTIAFLLALNLDEANWDVSSVFLSGCIGDKQHLGGFSGLNAQIIKVGKERGVIEERMDLNLVGKTIGEALISTLEPVVFKFLTEEGSLDQFLEKAGIDPQTNLKDFQDEDRTKLASLLSIELLKQNVRSEVIDRVTGPHFIVNGMDSKEISYIVDSCGRMDQMGLGFLIALSNESAKDQGTDIYRDYVKDLHETLMRLRNDGVKQAEAFDYFYTKDEEATLAGTLAELTRDYVLDGSKPVLSLTHKGEETRVSARATHGLFNNGLDLAKVMFEAAEHVGGSGGGHPVASGATIPTDKEKEFLQKVDSIIKFQLE